MKKNEIMPLATTWMDLEMIILNEVRYMISLIYIHTHMYVYAQTHKLIHKTEIDTQTQKTNFTVTKGEKRGRDKLGAWN